MTYVLMAALLFASFLFASRNYLRRRRERQYVLGACKEDLVLSETDIDAALDHLRSLPCRPARPVAWDRQHLLNLLREAIGKSPLIDRCYGVAPGVFAILKPFGVDLVSAGESDNDGRLQVWLLIRPCGTDPTRMTSL